MASDNFTFAYLSSIIEDNYPETVKLINEELEKINPQTQWDNDLNNMLLKLKDTKEIVGNLYRLKKEDQHGFSKVIDNYIKSVIKKIELEKEILEKQADQKFNELKPLIEELQEKSVLSVDFRQLRSSLVNYQNNVKAAELPRKQEDILLDLIQKTFESVSERQEREREKYEMECSENYLNLKKVVVDSCNYADNVTDFKDARHKLIDLQNRIKELKLKRDHRDELYAIIRNSFNDLNERQDRERDYFETVAGNNYQELRIIVAEACNYADTTDNYQQARETLISAQKRIKGVKLRRDDRDKLFSDIRDVFNKVNDRQNSERDYFNKECMDNYNMIKVNVDQAHLDAKEHPEFRVIREQLIGVQNDVKEAVLRRDQRNELFKRIREAFTILDERRNLYKDEKKMTRLEKLHYALENLETKLARLQQSQERDKDLLEHKNSASGDSGYDSGDENISSIEMRIQEKEEKISLTTARINDIKADIDSKSHKYRQAQEQEQEQEQAQEQVREQEQEQVQEQEQEQVREQVQEQEQEQAQNQVREQEQEQVQVQAQNQVQEQEQES